MIGPKKQRLIEISVLHTYFPLNDFRKAIEFDEKGVTIAKEIGDREVDGLAYEYLGRCLSNAW